jgi:hypothetical protein
MSLDEKHTEKYIRKNETLNSGSLNKIMWNLQDDTQLYKKWLQSFKLTPLFKAKYN